VKADERWGNVSDRRILKISPAAALVEQKRPAVLVPSKFVPKSSFFLYIHVFFLQIWYFHSPAHSLTYSFTYLLLGDLQRNRVHTAPKATRTSRLRRGCCAVHLHRWWRCPRRIQCLAFRWMAVWTRSLVWRPVLPIP